MSRSRALGGDRRAKQDGCATHRTSCTASFIAASPSLPATAGLSKSLTCPSLQAIPGPSLPATAGPSTSLTGPSLSVLLVQLHLLLALLIVLVVWTLLGVYG